jgi:nucleoside-diphosphate-sugar epimerase
VTNLAKKDENPEDMKLVNPSMLNGGPDTVVLAAGNATNIKTYIIYPPIIHGHSAGPGKALGVVQYLMKAKAEELGFIPYIGAGTTGANAVHTKDVSRFVLLVLSEAISSSLVKKESPCERCFIIGGKFMMWKDVANAFAKALFKEGIVKEGEARSVSLEEAGEGEVPKLMASDTKYTMGRSQKLGFVTKELGLIEFLEKGEDLF